jgi:hypothetical protein
MYIDGLAGRECEPVSTTRSTTTFGTAIIRELAVADGGRPI